MYKQQKQVEYSKQKQVEYSIVKRKVLHSMFAGGMVGCDRCQSERCEQLCSQATWLVQTIYTPEQPESASHDEAPAAQHVAHASTGQRCSLERYDHQ